MSALTDRFDAIAARFCAALARSGRPEGAARLVAVSKWHGAASVAELAKHWSAHPATGHPLFGESYMQEGRDKMPEVENLLGPNAPAMPHWHFIGHVQSRKAKEIAGRYAMIHSVDSLKLATAISRAWQDFADGVLLAPGEAAPAPQPVLVQVNVGQEDQKSGVAPDKLEELLTAMRELPGVQVEGLMCLPPFSDDPEATRPYFVMLRELRDKAASACGLKLAHLSMGMSTDFEAALEEGATLVRVGTDIFGPRVAAAK